MANERILGGSLLGVPIPAERCISYRPENGHANGTIDMMLDRFEDHATAPIDLESDAIEHEEKRLNHEERESAEKTVLGFSKTTMSILNRHSPHNAGNRFGGLIENPKFLEQKFKELDEDIKIIENDDSASDLELFTAYKLAREQDPKYVDHPLFKIGYLRAARYNTRRAARRILNNLREKLDLFGPKKLTHDICLEDLGEAARKFLNLGGLQVLPQRDNAGRRVIFSHAVLNGNGSDADILKARKAYFYFWTTLSEEDNEQGKVKGIVGIMWKVHDAKTSDPYVMQALVKI